MRAPVYRIFRVAVRILHTFWILRINRFITVTAVVFHPEIPGRFNTADGDNCVIYSLNLYDSNLFGTVVSQQ